MSFVWWKTQAPGLPLMSADPKRLGNAREKNNSGFDGDSDNESNRTYSVTDGFGSHVNGEGDPQLENPVLQDSSFDGLGSASETYVKRTTAEGKTMVDVNSRHREHDNGERCKVDGGPPLERPISGASNSESVNFSRGLHSNHAFDLQNGTTSSQVDKPEMGTSLSEEQNLERQKLVIPNAEQTFQHGGRVERSHHIRESHFPLNSTINPGSQDEQEVRRPFRTPDSESDASFQAYVPRTPRLREQVLLSDTWLTDKSFETGPDKVLSHDLPTDPAKLRQLKDHIGMELLWTEQAIQSRKKYLRLREGLTQDNRD